MFSNRKKYTIAVIMVMIFSFICDLVARPTINTARDMQSSTTPVPAADGAAVEGIAKDDQAVLDAKYDGLPQNADCGLQISEPATDLYGNRDSNVILSDVHNDPTGYFYDEADGRIISGGSISVAGPGVVTIIHNGSTGYYQFITDGTAGIYTIAVTLPPGYAWSTICTVTPGALDPTGMPNPYVLGNGENGSTGYLTSNVCTVYYLQFDLEAGILLSLIIISPSSSPSPSHWPHFPLSKKTAL
ncbi:hypothetical protein JW935_23220 [candidate division KSB1 bacterium]|nr:hypothetical protein [candidate division KSB1 bacterium]